jgi:hypothetical protein
MLRQQKLRRRPARPVGLAMKLGGIAGVWTFFGLLHVWVVEPPVAYAVRRLSFFRSLVGF